MRHQDRKKRREGFWSPHRHREMHPRLWQLQGPVSAHTTGEPVAMLCTGGRAGGRVSVCGTGASATPALARLTYGAGLHTVALVG